MNHHILRIFCLIPSIFLASCTMAQSDVVDNSSLHGRYKLTAASKDGGPPPYNMPCEITLDDNSKLIMSCTAGTETMMEEMSYKYDNDSILIMIPSNSHVVPDTMILKKINRDFSKIELWPKKEVSRTIMKLDKLPNN